MSSDSYAEQDAYERGWRDGYTLGRWRGYQPPKRRSVDIDRLATILGLGAVAVALVLVAT